MQQKNIAILAIVSLALLGCGGTLQPTLTYAPLAQPLQDAVGAQRAADSSLPSVLVSARVPGQSLVSVAIGRVSDGPTQAQPNTPFRVASIGKMFTAVAVLRLMEDGRIQLDMPAALALPTGTMTGLNRFGGKDRGAEITIRQLLQHRSGIADYFEDGAPDGQGLSPFKQLLLSNPDKLWEPTEMLAYVRANLPAVSLPDAGYHYSDTNYVLLGLIVEKATGKSLAQAYRDLFAHRLELNETHLEWREPARAQLPISDMHLSDQNLGNLRALSSDWGGGGLVMTSRDLVTFMDAVHTGRAFLKPTTRDTMYRFRPTGTPGLEYGCGILRLATPRGHLIGHVGFYGSFAFYADWQQSIIAGTVNQALPKEEPYERVLAAIDAARR